MAHRGGSAVKIADVRCFKVTGPAAPSLTEERQIGMLDIYPEYANRTVTRQSAESQRGRSADAVYVEVESDEGHVGLFGPIFPETAYLILTRLRSHLVGQDPLATERVWDVMYRQDRHAREDRKSTRLNSSHVESSYAVLCLSKNST